MADAGASAQPVGTLSASEREGLRGWGGEGNSITEQEPEEAFSPSASHRGQLIASPAGLVTSPCLPGALMRSQQWIPEKVVPSEPEGRGREDKCTSWLTPARHFVVLPQIVA